MLGYLRTITIGILTLLAISSATVAPAMADDEFQNPWEDARVFWADIPF
jgi:hypothetical protein